MSIESFSHREEYEEDPQNLEPELGEDFDDEQETHQVPRIRVKTRSETHDPFDEWLEWVSDTADFVRETKLSIADAGCPAVSMKKFLDSDLSNESYKDFEDFVDTSFEVATDEENREVAIACRLGNCGIVLSLDNNDMSYRTVNCKKLS